MTPAERQRRYRQRQKKGRRIYRVAVDEARLADMLCAAGYLDPLAADDPEKQREALERAIGDLELSRYA